MKKFLFTLAALLMAGSAFADDYLYINNFEVKQSELGTEIEVVVSAHFDAMVSAYQVDFVYPEGMVATYAEKGADYTIDYLNQRGRTTTCTPTLANNDDYTRFIAITSAGESEYDYIDGELTNCGAIKWKPGDYEEFFILYFDVTEDFKGGEIEVVTQPSSGTDPRGEVTPRGGIYTHVCTVTVEGGVMEQTEAPVITTVVDEDAQTVTIIATGNGTVILYNDDVEVARGEGEAIYVVNFTDDPEGEEMGFSATAQEPGKEVSDYALATVEIPGKPKVEVTDAPVIDYTAVDGVLTVTATGNGTVVLNVGNETNSGEGSATIVVEYDIYQGIEVGATAYAKEEGKEVSETVELNISVGAVVPEVTDAPVINVEEGDDAYTITATGNGTVILYVNDEPVEMPYTIDRPEAGEDPIVIYVYATAQEEGKEVGTAEVIRIEVEPKAGSVDPGDHNAGYWIVTFDKDGNEIWERLMYSNKDYTCIVRFEYETYGTFDYYGGETRPNESFYIVVDGVRYGAAEDGTIATLGFALENPLFDGENLYVLEEALGRVYNMGVAIDPETGEMYVYAAVAGYVDVNEVNADKAVAGVRYFNMAGQEMKEANGMTIVVTTYTDGTTSAVKVMK